MLTWIADIFRYFISFIDKMVYWFIELLISIFDSLANVEVFENGGIIEQLSKRLFSLIAIVMIFKVSFSIIQYIINPDNFNNQERGMGKVIQSILIVLIALVSVNTIFSLAYDLQRRIVNSNIIPSLILGINKNFSGEQGAEEQAALKRKIPFSLLQAFVQPNYNQIGQVTYKDGTFVCNVPMYDADGQYDTSFGDCLASQSTNSTYGYLSSGGQSMSASFQDVYNEAYTNNNYSLLLDIINEKSKSNSDVYILDYKLIISTVAGVFVAIMYINFCIDLAIRSVKFGFLQLISPIPIISMIDPKSSKSGMMSKYVKTCINTYLGLFLRVAAVNFVVLILDIIFAPDFIKGSSGIFISIVILFGALMFAKDVPKLISELTGVDFKGDFKLNPFQRVTSDPIAGKVVAGGLGLVGGAGANMLATAANFKNMKWKGNNALGTAGNIAKNVLGSPLGWAAGGLSAGTRGLFTKEKGGIAGARSAIKGSVAARNLRDARQENGDGGISGVARRAASDIQNWAGVDAAATKFDKQISAYSEIEQDASAILQRATDEMIKYEDIEFKDSAGNDVTMREFKIAKENLNSLRNRDTSHMSAAELSRHNSMINDLQTAISITEKNAAQAYINYAKQDKLKKANGDSVSDERIKSMIEGLDRKIETSSDSKIKSGSAETGATIKKLKDDMGDAIAAVKNSEAYAQAQINKKNDTKK